MMLDSSIKTQQEGLSWYWKRLKRVPLGEFPYRIGQLAKKKADKYLVSGSAGESCTIDSISICKIDVSRILAENPECIQDIIAEADRVIQHEFHYFGISAVFGPKIDWHLDPKTNRSWPLVYWGDINYRDAQTIGGIKFAWELNRLHHFPILALASAISNNHKYSDELFDQLSAWLKDNPYSKGINWISGIELGIRLVNLVFALKLLAIPVSPERHLLISEFVGLHAKHLYRYPSKYTSAANHALAEAIGLFVAGLCFPGFKSAKKWKKRGKEVLESEVERQIQADGSSFEHSIPYLQFVIDHYLVYCALCDEHGESYGEHVAARLKSSLEFISAMLDSCGNYPMIGDDDSGYLLKLWVGQHNNFRSILDSGSRLFNDFPVTRHNDSSDLKSSILFSRTSARDASRRTPPAPSSASQIKYFQDAGLVSIRAQEPVDVLLVGNGSPLGLKPLGAHGHADALSIWLSIDGNPIFVDPGTYLYHSGGKWRDYFRSTAAHNTVRIDKVDQATILADFIYDDFYEVFDVQLSEDPGQCTWSAKHGGYHRLPDPVTHGRSLTVAPGNASIQIEDTILCKKEHLVERFFHLHPDCRVSRTANGFRIVVNDIIVDLRVEESDCEAAELNADDGCRGGWFSPGFNQLQPTVTLRFAKQVAGNTILTSSIEYGRASNSH